MRLFDIMGPVMVGPSSSHTAGAARIGNMGRTLLGEEVARADIGLHGSFAETGFGHGTDRALLAGLLGMKPDDLRIPESFAVAAEQGLTFTFQNVQMRNAHPNTARLKLTGANGRALDIVVNCTGDLNTLIVRNQDESGSVAAITSILSQVHINVANMSVNRHRRGGDALMVIETDQHIKPRQVEFLSELPGILSVTYYDKEDDEDGAGFDEGNL